LRRAGNRIAHRDAHGPKRNRGQKSSVWEWVRTITSPSLSRFPNWIARFAPLLRRWRDQRLAIAEYRFADVHVDFINGNVTRNGAQ